MITENNSTDQDLRQKVKNFLNSWDISANDEQVSLITSVHESGNAVGEAVPGSGKTSVIVAMAHYLMQSLRVQSDHVLIMAFNTDCAELIRTRLARLRASNPMAFRTVSRTYHSVGYQICKEIGRSDLIQSNKEIMIRAIDSYTERHGQITMDLNEAMRCVSFLKNKGAYIPLGSNELHVPETAYAELGYDEEVLTDLFHCYERVKGDMIDFDDQILVPCNQYRLAVDGHIDKNPFRSFAKLKYLFLDELQDANAGQMLMAKAIADLSGCKVIGLGDRDQCLVPGSMVTMADGSKKAIETIVEGEEVLALAGGQKATGKVSKVIFHPSQKRKMVRITTTDGHAVESTPHHTHFAGFNGREGQSKHIVYLMQKGKMFRIGTGRSYADNTKASYGHKACLAQEGGDAIWILSTHPNERDARIQETILSLRYQIPTILFMDWHKRGENASSFKQEDVDRIFTEFGLATSAYRLLASLNMFYESPHAISESFENTAVITITLCRVPRGKAPLHGISVVIGDIEMTEKLKNHGFNMRLIRPSQCAIYARTSSSFGELLEEGRAIGGLLRCRIEVLGNVGNGMSLPFYPASHVRPGMVMYNADGRQVEVASVEFFDYDGPVYDLNINGFHNYIANDICQHNSIYGWRGANAKNVEAFLEHFTAKQFPIPKNYRSGWKILKASASIIRGKEGRENYKIIAGRDDIDGEVHEINCIGPVDEGTALCHLVKSLSTRYQPRQIFILGRTNAAVSAAARTLYMEGHPVTAKLDEYQNEFRQVTNAVAAVANHPNANLRETLKYVRLIGEKRAVMMTGKGVDLDDVDAQAVGHGKIYHGVQRFLDGMKRVRLEVGPENVLKNADNFRQVIHEVKNLLHEFIGEYSGSTAMNMRDELDTVVNFIIDLANKIGPADAIEKLYEFDEVDLAAERQNCIQLMTAHRAKGQENDCVILIDGNNFPCTQVSVDSEIYDQERNLLFVAMSRAKETLVIMRYPKKILGPRGATSEEIVSRFYNDVQWDSSIKTGQKELMEQWPSSNGPAWKQVAEGAVSSSPKTPVLWPTSIKEFASGEDFQRFKAELFRKVEDNDLVIYPCQPNNDWANPSAFKGVFADMLDQSLGDNGEQYLCSIYNNFMSKSIKPEEDRLRAHHTWLRLAGSLIGNRLNSMSGNGWAPAIFSKRMWLRSIIVQRDWLRRVAPGDVRRPVTETYACASLCLSITGHPRVRPELQLKVSHVRFALSQGAQALTNLMRYELIPVHGLLPMVLWRSEKDYGKSMKKGEGFGSAIADMFADSSFQVAVGNAITGVEQHLDTLLCTTPINVPVGGHVWVHVEPDTLWPLHPASTVLVDHTSGKQKDFFDPASAFKDDKLYNTVREAQVNFDGFDPANLPALLRQHGHRMFSTYKDLPGIGHEALVARLFNTPSSLVSSEAAGKRTLFVVQATPQMTMPDVAVEAALGETLGKQVKFKIM